MNRRSFLKRTTVLVVAAGMPVSLLPKALEAAPEVPSLTLPDNPIYIQKYPSPIIPEIWNDKLFKKIIKDNSNTKRKG